MRKVPQLIDLISLAHLHIATSKFVLCNLLSMCCASDHANPHFLVVKDGITVDRLGSFAAKGVAVNCCNIPPEVNHSIQ